MLANKHMDTLLATNSEVLTMRGNTHEDKSIQANFKAYEHVADY